MSPKALSGDISPLAVFILHGGNDLQLPENSGQLLLEVAGEPKRFWLGDGSDHHSCDTDYPEEFEKRIIDFFRRIVARNLICLYREPSPVSISGRKMPSWPGGWSRDKLPHWYICNRLFRDIP